MSIIPALFEYYELIDHSDLLLSIEYFLVKSEWDSYNLLLNYSIDSSHWNNILALKTCYIQMLPTKQSQRIVYSKYWVDVNNIWNEYINVFDKLFLSNIFAYANKWDLSNLNLLLYKYEKYTITKINQWFLGKFLLLFNIKDKTTKTYLEYLHLISNNYANWIIQQITFQDLENIYNQLIEYRFNIEKSEFIQYFISSKIKYLKLLILKELFRCIFEFKNDNSIYLQYWEIQSCLVEKFQKIYEEKYWLPSMLDTNDNIEDYNLDINESITDYKTRVDNIIDLIKQYWLNDFSKNTVEIVSVIDILELVILNWMYNNNVIRPDIKEQIVDRLSYLSSRYDTTLILDKITDISLVYPNPVFENIFDNINL